MTTPIKPDTGGVPPPLPPTSKEVKGKTKTIAGKVSKVTATTPSVPDPKTLIAAIREQMDLEKLLKIATPVRDIILNDLSDVELKTFEIALSKGSHLEDCYKETFQSVKKQIIQIRNEHLLKEILTDHPNWKSQVESWKTISLEDKIWLCQVQELQNNGVYIPIMDKRFYTHALATPALLESEARKSVNDSLSNVKNLRWSDKNLNKCPKAIHLLVNLERIDLRGNQLTDSPDVSRFSKLRAIDLSGNPLTTQALAKLESQMKNRGFALFF